MLTLIQARTEVHYDQVLALMERYRDGVVKASDAMGVCA